MDFKKWEKKVSNLDIYDHVKTNIIHLFKICRSRDSLDFIKIKDPEISKIFYSLNNYKNILVCFDTEFQSAISNNKKYITAKNMKGDCIARFVRELGGLFFVKDCHDWYYIGYIFINLSPLEAFGFKKKDLRHIESKYASVTNETLHIMEQNEESFHLERYIKMDNICDLKKKLVNDYIFKKIVDPHTKKKILKKIETLTRSTQPESDLRYIEKMLYKIQFEIYGKYLNQELIDKLSISNDTYWNDSQVKERLIKNQEDTFFDLFKEISNETIFLVKGKMDFIAMKNSQLLISGKNNINFDHYYDIETFNGFSSLVCKSSQLENTYNCLINKKYPSNIKKLLDQIKGSIGGIKAHNPLVDSYFTIVVAIIINSGLNQLFI